MQRGVQGGGLDDRLSLVRGFGEKITCPEKRFYLVGEQGAVRIDTSPVPSLCPQTHCSRILADRGEG